jgi:hypothetical protein
MAADSVDLLWGGHRRHEDPRSLGQLLSCECDGDPMIASRRSHDARLRKLTRQEVRKRASGLKKPGMLAEFQFEEYRRITQVEVGTVSIDDWRSANMRADQALGERNPRGRKLVHHTDHWSVSD